MIRRIPSSFVPIGLRLFSVFGDADCRFAFVVTGPEWVAQRVLGEVTSQVVTFVDPDLELVTSLGLERLPAFVLLRQDTSLVTASEQMHVSRNTAKTHLKHIFEKVGVSSKVELLLVLTQGFMLCGVPADMMSSR